MQCVNFDFCTGRNKKIILIKIDWIILVEMRDFDDFDSHSERLLVAQSSGSMIRRSRRRVFLSPCRCCRTETQEQRVSLLKSLRRRVGARRGGTHQRINENVMQPQLSTRGFFARPSRRTYTNAQFSVNENIHSARASPPQLVCRLWPLLLILHFLRSAS